ncbi:MAG: serine/threonine-protein kinase [Myxococcota bacterium]|nr:serine/threonine-protein kinase [Myxococcota bacterium]
MTDHAEPTRSCHSCGAPVADEAAFCGRCGARFTHRSEALADQLIGQVIEQRFRIERRIATGGMGTVYQAEHVGIGKQVAVKFLRADLRDQERLVQRMRREAMAVSKLTDVHTISVFDFGIWRGLVYLVMELLQGQDLAQTLSTEKALSLDRSLRVARQICSSLAEAHEAGVIHRDLKPENIFLTYSASGEEVVKVLDFGLAKFLGTTDAFEGRFGTQDGALLGTPYYMAPEQVNGNPIGPKADLYALGALLYRMLKGVLPFSGRNPLEVFSNQRKGELESLDMNALGEPIPPQYGALIRQLLSYRAEDRPANALTVSNELRGIGAASGWVSREAPDGPTRIDFSETLNDDRGSHVQAETRAGGFSPNPEKVPEYAMDEAQDSDPWSLDSAGDVDGSGDFFQPFDEGDIEAEFAFGQAKPDADDFARRLRAKRLRRIWLFIIFLFGSAAGAYYYYRYFEPPVVLTEREPNDEVRQANEFRLGQSLAGFIGRRSDRKKSDQDVFALRVSPSVKAIDVNLTGVPELDLVFDVFTYDGMPIEKVNRAGTGMEENATIFTKGSTRLFVRVREVWVEGQPPRENSTDPYRLSIRASTPVVSKRLLDSGPGQGGRSGIKPEDNRVQSPP